MKILLALLIVLWATTVEATVYWVSPTLGSTAAVAPGGCASASGATPPSSYYRTIAGAIACLGSTGGDTVNIRQGTYTGNITESLFVNKSGTSYSNPTTIQAYGTELVTMTNAAIVFSGAAGMNSHHIIFKADPVAHNWVLDGGGIAFGQAGNTGLAQFIKVDGLEVKNIVGVVGLSAMIFVNEAAANNIWFTNMKVHAASGCSGGPSLPPSQPLHAFYIQNTNNIIENSEIFDVPGYGIHNYHQSGPGASNNIYRNNRLHDISRVQLSFCTQTAFAIGIVTGTGNVVSYNQVYHNAGGIDIKDGASSSSQNVLYNNTFYDNGTGSLPFAPYPPINATTSNLTIKNNIVFGNNPNSIMGGATVSNNLTTTPSFVDAPGANFNLNAGSPAIDTGIASICTSCSPAIVIPVCGTPPGCYNSSFPDIGALEFGVVATVASVTWTCDRCSSTSGTAILSGSNPTTFTLPAGINYAVGENHITVIATDTNGATATDSIIVTYAPSFPGATMAGAWPFEGTLGTTPIAVPDYTTNGNNGTLIANAARVTGGKFSQAVLLDGVKQSVNVPDANSLDFTRSFTFSAHVFPINSPTTFVSVITKNHPSASIDLFSSTQGICSGPGIPAIVFSNNGGFPGVGTQFVACGTKPLSPNQWTHLAGTYDGPGPGSTLKLYVNGGVAPNGYVVSVPASGYIEPSDPPASNPQIILQIGATQFGEYFTGRIAEPRVRNYAILPSWTNNNTPGAVCSTAAWQENNNVGTASVIGDNNCPIILPVTPPVVNVPAGATGLKVSATSGAIKFPVQ